MDEPESMSALTLAARETPRQPGLRGQLQPAAARRPGARQRPHHRRTRGAVQRRRLERDQAALGLGLGRLFARDTGTEPCAPSRAPSTASSRPSPPTTGAYNREHFFGQNAELAALAQGLTDEQIDRLKRGGHDLVKIHAAYARRWRTRAARR
jgi:pyruvate dehydrogenase E1 component